MSKELDKSLVEGYVDTQREIAEIENKISLAVADLQAQLKEREEKAKEMKGMLKEAMKKNEVKKFENDIITLTYVAPTTRTSIDTKKLKEKKPELWDEYSKTTNVSDSIRIKVK